MNYQKQVIIIIALSVLIGAIFNTLRHDGIKWLAEPIKTVTDPEDALNILAEPSNRERDIETASRSLKAMSHPLRLMILCKLGEGEFSVQDIVDNVGTSQSNISQHLAILRDKGILSARKDANKVFYKVSDFKTLKLIDMMREVFCSKHN